MRQKNELAEHLGSRRKPSRKRRFRPQATYNADGDCIQFFVKPDSYYGERLDSFVTVYRSHETGELTGASIKGVSKFVGRMLKSYPGFANAIQDGRVELWAIFTLKLWSSKAKPGDDLSETYRQLIDAADESQAVAELCDV